MGWGLQSLRSAAAARTAHATNEDTDWFLRLWLYGRSVDRFWIAFDDRAASPPSWLTKDFKKVTPAVFLSSTQSYFAGGQVKRVRYQLWEPKAGFADYIEGGIRTLGGNNAKGVAWKTGTTGSQYLVVLRMRPRPDTSTRLEALGLATLKVTDAHGSYSTTDFVVDVVDSRIDSIQPPPDRWVVVADPAGTPVQIGTAGASDVCSGVVEIENDAPASGLFPLGFTPVTWVFDDTHGNLVRHVQRVFVVDQAFFPPPVSEIEISVPEVSPGQSVSIVHRTWPQGKGMLLDEYVLIRDGAGGIWSIDSSGGIAPGVVPRATWNNLGASATTATVFSGAIDPYLPGPGFYTVEAVLVVPGGDPLDASEIVGWSRSELEIVR